VRASLFVTCFNDTLFPQTGRAVVRLLERLGCDVDFPLEQTCCGQMHMNSGYVREGAALARRFGRVFSDAEVVVTPSASCAGMVREHTGGGTPVYELSELLVDVLGLEDVGAYYPHRVTYHPTCHSLRQLHVGARPLRLLRAVRGIELVELPQASECCGFGGTFAVKYSDISGAIVEAKAKNIEEAHAPTVLAGDLGCLMNMAGKLSRDGRPVQVRHVAEVLAGMTDEPPIGAAKTAAIK
jgi:L-lactate dehydrogenase complex protein LldE